MLVSVLLIATLLCSSHGFTIQLQDDTEAVSEPRTFLADPQSDAYIDMILENLRQLILDENMDPMDLPDLETGFSDTVLGITWHGKATLKHGKFWSLSTIARTGDTSFTVTDNVLELTAMLSLDKPHAHYDAHADFMGIGVNAGVTLNVKSIEIYLDATATLTSEGLAEGALQVQDFRINHLGNIDVDISGLGPLDWILEILVDLVDEFFRDWIKDLVEGPLRDLIQSLFDSIHFDIPPFIAPAYLI